MNSSSFIVLLSIVLFLLLAGYQIELPGIYYDEVLQMPAAIDLLKGQVNGGYHKFGSQEIFGVTLTLMNLDYIGAVKCYLLALSMGIFDIDVRVMRYTVLVIFVIGLVAFWRFAKEEYGETAAAITVILIATDPSLMMLSRGDFGPIVVAFITRSFTLWLAARWWRTGGKSIFLIAAGFFAGLGFYDKINFSWFIVALLFTGIAAYLIGKRLPKLSLWAVLLTLVAALVASLPFWIYNFYYNWPFLTRINQGMTMNDYFSLIPQRTDLLVGLIDGTAPSWLYFTSNDLSSFSTGKTLLLPLFLGSLILVTFVAVFRQQWHLLFLPGIIGLIALQIFLTPQTIGMHHWTMLYPMPHLIVGVAVHLITSQLCQTVQIKNRIGLIVLSIIVTVVVLVNCRVVSRYHHLLEKTGGSGLFSAAIYDLSDTLKRDYANSPLQLMDWGLNHTLFFLSSGTLYTNEPFWSLIEDSDDNKLIRELIDDPDNVFIFNAPSSALYPHIFDRFYKVIDSINGLTIYEVKVYDWRSRWCYSIIKIKRQM